MATYSTSELRSIFQQSFNRDAWKAIALNIFKANKLRSQAELFSSPDDPEQGYFMGVIDTPDCYRIGLFYYKITTGSVAHKKVGLRNLVKKFINQNWGEFDAAIVVFDDKSEWRLSFVCDIKEEATAPKRFTFVFGEHDNIYRTAIERFDELQNAEPTFDNIRKAFSVEALSDDFFDQYRELYADFVQYITGKRYVKESKGWVERQIDTPNSQYESTFDKDDKLVRDYVKKMFGRIVFLYFLQRKGWLNNNRRYMHDLFYESNQKDNFLDGVLESLFFNVLNEKPEYRMSSAKELPGSENIPYLNGGLFAKDEVDDRTCVFPEALFKSLFDFLDSYNFTIDENDPEDAEVGIDPEMLGRIFENLLEDNKDKGAFYTPKAVVDFMCRESIIAYLQNEKFSQDGNETIRRFVEHYDSECLSKEQRAYLKDKLKSLKICDPAIGSGAFPMGLVNLLSKLYQVLHLSTDFSVIKRHIMEQNIYGVDIEKGAVDIARLRFWLAMIVEEKEPMPLPNLHFKIMQGNSLLESYNNTDLSDLTTLKIHKSLFDSQDSERESLIHALRSYYKTSDHADRDRLFNEIKNNVFRQLLDKNIILPKGMDPSANSEFFLWHTWFSDVFADGGFDIVIGNPPYIQLQKAIGVKGLDKKGKEYDIKLGDLYDREGYETFAKTGDIYCLFYEQGYKMLKPNGHLCFITSNKWMRAGYGEKLRGFLAKSNPNLLVDFAGIQIFDNATVDTNILLVEKGENRGKTKCLSCASAKKETILENMSDFVQQNATEFSFNTDESWVILSPIELSIKRKIESVGVPLKDWDINIYRGVLTGYNEAFIISTEKRNEILANCQSDEERKKTEELIRPILRGRDIKRYGYDWANLWLIATFPSRNYDIEQYPAVKQYLLSFGIERLEQTGAEHIVDGVKVKARKKTNNKWFETQDSISYWEDFDKPKIAWASVGETYYSLIPAGFYLLDTNYFFSIIEYHFLLAFLNSKSSTWWINQEDTKIGNGGAYRHYKYNLERLNIPHIESSFLHTVNEILDNIAIESNEICINSSIYRYYNFTDEEIAFIESQQNQ